MDYIPLILWSVSMEDTTLYIPPGGTVTRIPYGHIDNKIPLQKRILVSTSRPGLLPDRVDYKTAPCVKGTKCNKKR